MTAKTHALSGSPVKNNDYTLDVRTGPIIGSSRQIGLGGAYIGVAEGINSLNINPAGVAFRNERSTKTFDWDWTTGLFSVKGNDFDNNGNIPSYNADQKILSLGIMGQWGPWGLGVLSIGQYITLETSEKETTYVIPSVAVVGGRQFLNQQLTVGGGIRSTHTKIKSSLLDISIGKLSAVGWQAGLVWNPNKGAMRWGVSYASKMESHQSLNNTSTTPVTVNGIIIPNQVVQPAQFGIGTSYQTKSAPFWKNHACLIAGDIVVIPKSHNSVGLESVLEQVQQPIGTRATTSVRVGGQVEALPHRLRLRLGSYYEPSYYEDVSARWHLTSGLEVRLFKMKMFWDNQIGFSATVDAARGYLNQMYAFGFWY